MQRPDRHGHWVEFTYDALGRRLSKSASEQTNWLWNGNVPLHEWTSGQRYEDKGWKPYEEDVKTWIFEENSFIPLALLQDGYTKYAFILTGETVNFSVGIVAFKE